MPPAGERKPEPPLLPWWAGSALFGLSLGLLLSLVPEPWEENWWALLLVSALWAVLCQIGVRLANRLAARR